MAKHCMLDLETWGTGPDALIISIGAVMFDTADASYMFDVEERVLPMDKVIESWDKFHVAIDPCTCMKSQSIEAGTLMWWMDKDRREALDSWLGMEKVDFHTALEGFSLWYRAHTVSPDQPINAPEQRIEIPVWGNASTFDNVILRRAFDMSGITCPWSFRLDSCYRTMRRLFKSSGGVDDLPAFDGVAHNALNDAVYQATNLLYLMEESGMEELA